MIRCAQSKEHPEAPAGMRWEMWGRISRLEDPVRYLRAEKDG